MGTLLLGIDIGTTATKALLLDTDAGIVAQAARPTRLYSDQVGYAEADPDQWWNNIADLVRHLTRVAGANSWDIAGLACSGMVPAVLVLDAHGRPLRRAILHNDARAHREITDIAAACAGLNFSELTGSTLSQQSVAPTLFWLQRHEPEVYRNIETVCGSYDSLAVRLGGIRHVEGNWALECGLFMVDGEPLHPVRAAAGLTDDLIPPIRRTCSPVGEVSPEAAADTGLQAGTPIFTGGADHVLSACAAALHTPGDWLVKLGGGGDILAVSDTPLTDPRLYLDQHPISGRWLPNGCMATSGSLVRWLADLTGTTDLLALGREAEVRTPGEVLCLPYFLGEKSPLHDPHLRGAFVGLDLAHDAASLYRAVLEAVAFGFRRHVEIFGELGISLNPTATVSNGGAGSPIWLQIHADVLGRPLTPILNHPGAALGAALAAAVGTGLVANWTDAAHYLSRGDPITPDPGSARRYDEIYATWRELSDILSPISHRVAGQPTRG